MIEMITNLVLVLGSFVAILSGMRAAWIKTFGTDGTASRKGGK